MRVSLLSPVLSRVIRLGAAAALALLVSSPCLQASTGEGPPAEVLAREVQPNEIYWHPAPGSTSQQLTVSGPHGIYLQKTFDPGSTPFLSISEEGGGPLPDGRYRYELRSGILTGRAHALKSTENGREGKDLPESSSTAEREALEPTLQVGHFTVSDGSFVVASADETTAAKSVSPLDVVVNDDQIVTGSLCVGFDCVDGEGFGFDTIRLKENNLRIKFEDTSSTGSFPTNDWSIVVNDSSEGGGNYFAVEDVTGIKTPFTIVAGAPTASMYVDNNGRLGLKTSTPVLEVHMKDGDTPSIRMEQDNTSGWTAQTWDVAGNESNFFIRDTTNGSKLPFRIQPGAPTNSLSVRSNGRVGLGTWDPAAPMELTRNDGATQLLVRDTLNDETSKNLLKLESYSGAYMEFTDTTTGKSWDMGMDGADAFLVNNGTMELSLADSGKVGLRNPTSPFLRFTNTTSSKSWSAGMRGAANFFIGNGTADVSVTETGRVLVKADGVKTFDLRTNGNLILAGTLTQNSDRDTKHRVSPADGPAILSRLQALPISTWVLKHDENQAVHLGPMAQDFYSAFGLGSDERHIAPMDAAGIALAAVKELQRKIDEKEALIAERDTQMQSMQQRIALLESRIERLLAGQRP